MGQVTVFSGPERRRRWADEERLAILSEAFAPGACVADVARRRDVATSLIYSWRRKLQEEANAEPVLQGTREPGFAEAVMVDDGAAVGPGAALALVIDLAGERRISVFASASPAQVAAALKALR